MTRVVNLRDKVPFDVYIGRPGKGVEGYFGNPCRVGIQCPECGFVHTVSGGTLACFEQYARRRMEHDQEYHTAVKNLKGKTLGCFCKPRPCHGDILAKLAEE